MHGLGLSARDHYVYCAELASQGYLVMSIDTICGCCPYTELSDGTEVWLNKDLKNPLGHTEESYQMWRPIHESRVDQVKTFIDELQEGDFL